MAVALPIRCGSGSLRRCTCRATCIASELLGMAPVAPPPGTLGATICFVTLASLTNAGQLRDDCSSTWLGVVTPRRAPPPLRSVQVLVVVSWVRSRSSRRFCLGGSTYTTRGVGGSRARSAARGARSRSIALSSCVLGGVGSRGVTRKRTTSIAPLSSRSSEYPGTSSSFGNTSSASARNTRAMPCAATHG